MSVTLEWLDPSPLCISSCEVEETICDHQAREHAEDVLCRLPVNTDGSALLGVHAVFSFGSQGDDWQEDLARSGAVWDVIPHTEQQESGEDKRALSPSP